MIILRAALYGVLVAGLVTIAATQPRDSSKGKGKNGDKPPEPPVVVTSYCLDDAGGVLTADVATERLTCDPI